MDQDRLDKWDKFLVAGLKLGNPVDFDTTNVLFLNKTNDGIEIDACGRVMEIMNLGNIIFLHIERTIMNFDKEPVIKLVQIVVSKKDAPEAHSLVKTFIQRGDIIGVSGVVYTTNIGVKSIKAIKLCLLTKCFNWVGKVLNDDSLVSDKEELYRKPYIRMNVDNTTRDAFFAKALLLKILRQHLENEGFTEIETRILVPTNGGANAAPFTTHYNNIGEDRYLRIAPELDLKRAVVAGLGDVYEIGRCFRNEGRDKTHNPEFTTMEAYKTYQNYTYWIDLFKRIYDSLTYFVDKQSSSSKWVEMKMIDFVSSYIPTTHETLVKDFDKLMDDPEVIAKYPYLIITHHPTYDSPLAKPADNLYAERAEVFIRGMEVANMYTENVDPILQRKVFEEQIANKDNHMGIDEDFIHALELGCPPCSGIGIGVDRIVMQLFRLIDIRDVIMFPAYRTK